MSRGPTANNLVGTFLALVLMAFTIFIAITNPVVYLPQLIAYIAMFAAASGGIFYFGFRLIPREAEYKAPTSKMDLDEVIRTKQNEVKRRNNGSFSLPGTSGDLRPLGSRPDDMPGAMDAFTAAVLYSNATGIFDNDTATNDSTPTRSEPQDEPRAQPTPDNDGNASRSSSPDSSSSDSYSSSNDSSSSSDTSSPGTGD